MRRGSEEFLGCFKFRNCCWNFSSPICIVRLGRHLKRIIMKWARGGIWVGWKLRWGWVWEKNCFKNCHKINYARNAVRYQFLNYLKKAHMDISLLHPMKGVWIYVTPIIAIFLKFVNFLTKSFFHFHKNTKKSVQCIFFQSSGFTWELGYIVNTSRVSLLYRYILLRHH